MLADNFLRCVSFDPFRARIPTDYVPCCVEHENRIVAYGFYKKSEATLSFLQLRTGRSKLPDTIGNAFFQSGIEREQAGFQLLALRDVVKHTRNAAGTTRRTRCSLALTSDPVNSMVGMRDPDLDVKDPRLFRRRCR